MTSVSQTPPLPGFGLDLAYEPKGRDGSPLFATALGSVLEERPWNCKTRYVDAVARCPLCIHDTRDYDALSNSMLPLTLREIAMIQFMNQATDKKDWETKVFDDKVTQKWKAEVLERTGISFSKEMADYCIAELKYKAKVYKDTGFVSLYHGDVVKSDIAISPDLRDALKEGVAPLEEVPKRKQDWHPGSNDMVLDLVHPSLFPLVYGLSRILTDDTTSLDDCIIRSGQGELVPGNQVPPRCRQAYNSYSEKFQWLPSDIDISGEIPKIVSYINNLHPQNHRSLYSVIERILARVIPLWNATLTPLRSFDFRRRIKCTGINYGELDAYTEKEGPKRQEGEGKYAFYDRQEEWKEKWKRDFLVHPNPGPFMLPGEDTSGPADEKVDLKVDYGKSGLQIIVKLANIHLTPERPEYSGGAWHVEGQENEHICATAIYYYDNENISASHLAFRQVSSTFNIEREILYDQYDYEWLEPIFGLENHNTAIQNIGSIEAHEGRLVTFPNILQHQVQPFKLTDPTKPGHRKILALFLVDPNMKIISTANIPCQQREWWAETITSSGGVLGRLPVELREMVVQDVGDFPISLDEARKLREELMEERKGYVIDQNQDFESITISLCEH